jgi:hypothetical protein
VRHPLPPLPALPPLYTHTLQCPLHICRFSQLSIAAGRSFGSIYPIQADGTWFRSPDEMLDAMGLLDKTMTSLAEYGQVGRLDEGGE